MTTKEGVLDTPEDGIAPHPVEALRPSDELYQPFPNTPVSFGIDPEDGLPTPTITGAIEDAKAPPLDPARFVCMADCTRFVLRNEWGDVVCEIDPTKVVRSPTGSFRTSWDALEQSVDSDAAREALLEWARGRKLKVPGDISLDDLKKVIPNAIAFAIATLSGRTIPFGSPVPDWIEVEPVRPQCRHYRRQFKDFPDSADRQMVIRLCTARVTDEGEFLSLRDSEMLACELRSPAIGSNAELIDEFDERVIATGRAAKEAKAEFDIDSALDAERQRETGE